MCSSGNNEERLAVLAQPMVDIAPCDMLLNSITVPVT
jgi:hypothetical protein